MMYMNSFDDNHKKSTKRNHIKFKQDKYFNDDDVLKKKAQKQFKQKKKSLEENDDDWQNWRDYIR